LKLSGLYSRELNAYANTVKAILELLKRKVYVHLRIHLDNKNKDTFSDIFHKVKYFLKYFNSHLFQTFLLLPEFEMSACLCSEIWRRRLT
jgi:hypothetical protein